MTTQRVKDRCVELMYNWSEVLEYEPKIKEAYQMLRRQGIVKQDPVSHDRVSTQHLLIVLMSTRSLVDAVSAIDHSFSHFSTTHTEIDHTQSRPNSQRDSLSQATEQDYTQRQTQRERERERESTHSADHTQSRANTERQSVMSSV